MWPNVTFNEPIYMTQAPGDDDRWYVVERGGTIKVLPTNATSDNDVKTFATIGVQTISRPVAELAPMLHARTWFGAHDAGRPS